MTSCPSFLEIGRGFTGAATNRPPMEQKWFRPSVASEEEHRHFADINRDRLFPILVCRIVCRIASVDDTE